MTIMRFWNWLKSKVSPPKTPARPDLRQTGSHLRQTGSHQPRISPVPKPAIPRRQPEYVDMDRGSKAHIEENGPGKNVLIRNRYVREDTGTHDTLKIIDDSIIETDEETGIDPYNTGQFDRSKNWNNRFRK